MTGGALPSGRLVFVVGASRSGTTMLCRVLGLHSMIFGMQEIHFFGDIWNVDDPDSPWTTSKATDAVARMLARQSRDIWGGEPTHAERLEAGRVVEGLDDFRPSALFGAFASYCAARERKIVPAEQTPRNIFYAARLLDIFPEARIIEVVRDPRAVLFSQRDRWKMRRLGARNVPMMEVVRTLANYHAITMSRLWRSAVRAGRRLQGHPRFTTVRYEDLVNDPSATVEKLCRFIGVEYESAMLQVPQIASSTRANNSGARGIARDALDRWKEGLPEGDRILCERVTFPEARALGYADVSSRSLWNWPTLVHLMRFPLHLVGVLLTNPKRALSQFRAIARIPG
jgi:hypothetical protein